MPYHFNPFTKKLDYSEHTKDVTTAGLVLAMNFNPETLIGTAGSEKVLDSSGYNNHGQNYGATAISTGGFNGGGALSFDGVDDYIDCGNATSLNPTSAITLEAWIKVNTVDPASQDIIEKWWDGTNRSYALFLIGDDVIMDVAFSDSNIDHIARYNDIITPGNWYHIVGTFDGRYIKVYVNGVLGNVVYDAGTTKTIRTNTRTVRIGGVWDGYFNGTIDEPHIYNNYALALDEIKQLYLQRKEIHNSFISQKNMYAVRVSTLFTKTADTTLTNIPGLSANLVAGKSYKFTVNLFVNADATGGHKYAMSGTVTATNIIYQINSVSNTTNFNVLNSRHAVLGSSAGQSGATIIHTVIEGLITVNTAGTLTCQFGQNAASGTSAVLIGSNMTVEQIL